MPPSTQTSPSSTLMMMMTSVSPNVSSSRGLGTSTTGTIAQQDIITPNETVWITSEADNQTVFTMPTLIPEPTQTPSQLTSIIFPVGIGVACFLVFLGIVAIVVLKVRSYRRKRYYISKTHQRTPTVISGAEHSAGRSTDGGGPAGAYATVRDIAQHRDSTTSCEASFTISNNGSSRVTARYSTEVPADASSVDKRCSILAGNKGHQLESDGPCQAIDLDTDDMDVNPKYVSRQRNAAKVAAASAANPIDRQDSMLVNPLYVRRQSAPLIVVRDSYDRQASEDSLCSSLPIKSSFRGETIPTSPGYGDWTHLTAGVRTLEAAEEEEDDSGGYTAVRPSSFTEQDEEDYKYSAIYDSVRKRIDHHKPVCDPPTSYEELRKRLKSCPYRQLKRQDVTLEQEIGAGEFGLVFRGNLSVQNQTVSVAVKTLRIVNNDCLRPLMQEAALMGQLYHRNVVRLCGIVAENEQVLAVLELMEKGDLLNHLVSLRPKSGESQDHSLPARLLNFSQDIANGMCYLASRQLVHRDLAARNVMVDSRNTCKIGDFGMSRNLADDEYYKSNGGRIPFRSTAIEALLYRKYSTASDVWSYGVVLHEIYTLGEDPYGDMTVNEVIKFLDVDKLRLPPPTRCSRALYKIMTDCWHPSASDRPHFGDITQLLNANMMDIMIQDSSSHPDEASISERFPDLQTCYQE